MTQSNPALQTTRYYEQFSLSQRKVHTFLLIQLYVVTNLSFLKVFSRQHVDVPSAKCTVHRIR